MIDTYCGKAEKIEAPTYEQVVRAANEMDLIGKVDTKKFFDYYSKSGFAYRGAPIDWKGKLEQWASSQRSQVKMTAAEYEILNKIPNKRVFRMEGGTETTNPMEYLRWVESALCPM